MDRQAPTTRPPAGPNGAWLRYRGKFITPDNVQNGVVFWNQYQNALQRAQQVYGVPPEIIVGIIGVETRWGRVMGKPVLLTLWRRCRLPIHAVLNTSLVSWKPFY
jgi:membrane-bound lytic murein transglycosylase B